MSNYTTGEIAKRCGVTVRTVQYYDTRGILTPSALSEGGRRLYSEDDLNRMRVICFLRDLGLPIRAISEMLAEDDPGRVITLLLEEQEQALRAEIGEQQLRLEKLESLRRSLRGADAISVESIGDAAYTMNSKKQLRKIHATMLLTGIPVTILQWGAIVLLAAKKLWWPLLVYAVVAVPYSVWVSRYYFHQVAYLCPQCHSVFQPSLKEAFWARHTPSTRKLTCPHCKHKGYCVEVAREEPSDH